MFNVDNYTNYKFEAISHRLIDFQVVVQNFEKHQHDIAKEIGRSYLGHPISLYKLGSGKTSILLWSQMHGNEPTATAALFDLINFFTEDAEIDKILRNKILEECTIYMVPVLNPDGLLHYTRRNVQNIDINRDYIAETSCEAKILKNLQQQIKPNFCFNLHDQDPWYGTSNKKEWVAMAFLAPPYNYTKEVNWQREQAMKLIVGISNELQKHIPNKIARFKDDFEPRAFGDQFQKAGAITVLIESGCLANDPEKQELRKLNFLSILKALELISFQKYQEQELIHYLMLPLNEKNHFHLLLKNVRILSGNGNYTLDIGLNYTEHLHPSKTHLEKTWYIEDCGDLHTFAAHETIEIEGLYIKNHLHLSSTANLEVFNTQDELVFHFVNGDRIW